MCVLGEVNVTKFSHPPSTSVTYVWHMFLANALIRNSWNAHPKRVFCMEACQSSGPHFKSWHRLMCNKVGIYTASLQEGRHSKNEKCAAHTSHIKSSRQAGFHSSHPDAPLTNLLWRHCQHSLQIKKTAKSYFYPFLLNNRTGMDMNKSCRGLQAYNMLCLGLLFSRKHNWCCITEITLVPNDLVNLALSLSHNESQKRPCVCVRVSDAWRTLGQWRLCVCEWPHTGQWHPDFHGLGCQGSRIHTPTPWGAPHWGAEVRSMWRITLSNEESELHWILA